MEKNKYLALLAILAVTCLPFLALPAWALEEFKPLATLQNAAVATGNGTELDVAAYNTVTVYVSIATTATVTFEGSVDGSAWGSVACTTMSSTSGTLASTATETTIMQCPVAGLSKFRARISSWGSGAVTVKARATTSIMSKKGGGGGVTGWPTDSDSKELTWANSLANAVRIGDGVTPICLYTDATLGPQVRPCTDANVMTIIPANYTWAMWDIEGAAAIETVDPDAATQLGKWSYGAAYRPLKSIWFGAGSLSTDGTQCAAPAEVTINSGPKIWTVICTDNDASTMYGSVKMPDSWDGGTVTFEHVYIQTAADTAVLNGDVAAQCRGHGEVPSSTWGTEVAIDDAAVTGSNSNDFTTSAAVTPAGTCAAGDMLYWRYQLDAAGTTTAVATLHHVGFKMEYSTTSRSD